MRKHPVLCYYALACGISWLGWAPLVAGSRGIAAFQSPFFQFLLLLPAVGPALAAVIVTASTRGGAGVRDLWAAFLRRGVGVIWYALAVLGPIVILAIAAAGTSVAEGEPAGVGVSAGNLWPALISTLVVSLLSNPFEEVGWRGFALPRLQERYDAAVAALMVGVLWGVWHLPLFLWRGNPMADYPFVPWLAGLLALSFIYTWLYNSARGSLAVGALFHVALNTAGPLFPEASPAGLATVYCLIALVLVLVVGPAHLSHRERVRIAGRI